MFYKQFLDSIIDQGIEAAKQDYEEGQKLEGAIAGFEVCRNKLPHQLLSLLREAKLETRSARNPETKKDNVEEYWYWRCRELEIEWICNVMSAGLLNQGLPTIIQPTARGMIKAAEILGVRS